jgi:1-deoxy-D-xylulose-5-phosphate reductoisomerase
MQKVIVLGSTGSIGRQTLDVIKGSPGDFKVTALTAYSNIELLEEQIHCFKPQYAAVVDEEQGKALQERMLGESTKILIGNEGVMRIAGDVEGDILVNALVGISGLLPTVEAINSGKRIALANKETLVVGGEIVKTLAKEKKVSILPIDSEHSAIFQCLKRGGEVEKIILTASGGPFFGYTKEQLKNVTAVDALRHPNWSMGKKITVDSATLMNKGLEVIEAHWLFEVGYEQIEVIIHPQSIIHSMVAFRDSAVMAQLGMPDMRMPIQYALRYPKSAANTLQRLDFVQVRKLEFYPPDLKTFPCLELAYRVGKEGGTLPVVLNGANEEAVGLFLQNKISFVQISRLIEQTLLSYSNDMNVNIQKILEVDAWSRMKVRELVKTN